jgi:hypothetical protein
MRDDDVLWDTSDLDCPHLKSDLEEPVNSKCETECTSEEDSEQINLLNLKF